MVEILNLLDNNSLYELECRIIRYMIGQQLHTYHT